MDFIPLPDGVSSHEAVPFLGGPDYDNSGFVGYDKRQGWDIDVLCRGHINEARDDWDAYERLCFNSLNLKAYSTTTKSRIDSLITTCDPNTTLARRRTLSAAFLQTWIVSGIFQEALERPVLKQELSTPRIINNEISKATAGRSITVQSVFREFLKGGSRWMSDSPAALHLVRCLREAAMVIPSFYRSTVAADPSMVPPSVYVSLAALVEEVYKSLSIFCSSHFDQGPAVIALRTLFIETQEGRWDWCPSITNRLQSLRISGLYYASLIPDLVPQQVHSRCSGDLCLASNIEKEKYAVQHIPQHCSCDQLVCDHKQTDCGCKMLSMPESSFEAAFEDEAFPLVRLREDAVEIVTWKPGSEYTAISHPWSDGRGNPAANALPICQMRSIHEKVAKAARHAKEHLFWIDTLCVPIEEPLRNTAVLRMAKVYSAATMVLVLSADFSNTAMPSTLLEISVRIISSKWSTRLWLLQEAVLAKDLVFCFSDGHINFKSVEMGLKKALLNVVDQSSLLALAASEKLDQAWGLEDRYKSMDLTGLIRGLRYRTSSRLLDTTICGSILLGTDLKRVLDAPDEMKVETFWSCQSKVPIVILFTDGPRLTTSGFRWALAELLHPDVTSSDLARRMDPKTDFDAQPTPKGLSFCGLEAIGIDLSEALLSEAQSYRFSLEEPPREFSFFLGSSDIPWKELDRDLGTSWREHSIVFLAPERDVENPEKSAALMVSVEAEEETQSEMKMNVRRGRYIRPISLRREDGSDYTRWTSALSEIMAALSNVSASGTGRPSVMDLTVIRKFGRSQQWLIV